jgi:pimeloyl-ACP methyl ester carboxylesterase
MLRRATFRRRPAYWCAATLTLSACSAAEAGQNSDDSTGNPASMTPGVTAPPPVSPTPTLPPSGSSPQTPSTTENDPTPVGFDPVPPGGAGGLDPDSQPVPPGTTAENPPGVILDGECCSDGDCLCHGPAPTELTNRNGSFQTTSVGVDTGTLFYPTDAEPPFAALAIAAGFLNTGVEILDWGEFFASHGIVTLVTTTGGADFPDLRATKLAASIAELKRLDAEGGNPLSGKLSGRYGTSGYSMGGGGTTLAASKDKSLLSSVGLAPWAPVGDGITTPTLLLCGSTDTIAPCSMAEGAYAQIPESTPKMMVVLPLVGHLDWLGGPTAPNLGGAFALAFMKLYLEGDERWKSVLIDADGDVTTSITE